MFTFENENENENENDSYLILSKNHASDYGEEWRGWGRWGRWGDGSGRDR